MKRGERDREREGKGWREDREGERERRGRERILVLMHCMVMVSTLYFQLKSMQLSHLEDIRQREEEVEAQYAGQMAYLKLHHKELIEDMQAKHNLEVCVYSSVYVNVF